MSYSIEIDKEISVGDKVYYALVRADVEFRDWECPEPTGVEITLAQVSPLDGDPLALEYSGRAIEKVIVTGLPELTEAIGTALWDKIQLYGEDNCYEIQRDLRDACDERDL